MEIIALSNQKGGVGKTTSAINIGAGLARMGKTVCLVDLDSQANMTHGLGIYNPDYTINGIMLHKQKISPYLITDNLSLVACDDSISSFEKNIQDKIQREFILKKALQPLIGKYDFLIMDCPPVMSMITINAYSFANDVYVPLEAQKYSIEGLLKVEEMVDVVKEINPSLNIKGIFFTKHNPRRILNRDVELSVRKIYKKLVFNTHIRENVSLEESPHASLDIFRYAPNSIGANDYKKLIEEILDKKY